MEPARQLEALVSWTSFPEFEEFSGTASYRCEFRIPEAYLAGGTQLKLDLGEVRDVAEVKVNRQSAGTAWKHPFTLDVTRWARAGHNHLEVRVTNRLINRMRVRPPLPQPYTDLKDRVTQPVSSGLLGPVRLRPLRRVILTK
jgi:hypothetical protein